MKRIATAIVLLAVLGTATAEEPSLKVCQPIGKNYHIEPYLIVAKELQNLGQDNAVVRLRKWAKGHQAEDQTIILTRMLFEKKEGGDIRGPMLGGAELLGGTTYLDWPALPITLYQGIPILITKGFSLAGVAEPSEDYLEECIRHGSWRGVKYATVDQTHLDTIIEEFIKATKWKRPLSCEEESFLRKQCAGAGR